MTNLLERKQDEVAEQRSHQPQVPTKAANTSRFLQIRHLLPATIGSSHYTGFIGLASGRSTNYKKGDAK
jgi:hypothetical protein